MQQQNLKLNLIQLRAAKVLCRSTKSHQTKLFQLFLSALIGNLLLKEHYIIADSSCLPLLQKAHNKELSSFPQCLVQFFAQINKFFRRFNNIDFRFLPLYFYIFSCCQPFFGYVCWNFSPKILQKIKKQKNLLPLFLGEHKHLFFHGLWGRRPCSIYNKLVAFVLKCCFAERPNRLVSSWMMAIF